MDDSFDEPAILALDGAWRPSPAGTSDEGPCPIPGDIRSALPALGKVLASGVVKQPEARC